MICDIGTAPPMPLSDSIAALTAPQLAAVVTAANSAEEAMPKRCSLPSMFGPVRPAACIAGVVRVSAAYSTATATTNRASITANSVQPWRRLPTIRP